MIGPEKPTQFKDAMSAAREYTVTSTEEPDDRTEFDVYLAVAERVVRGTLGSTLEAIPISDTQKKELVGSATYALAQPAHLKDASIYEPNELVEMLDGLGVFAFDCLKHCKRRGPLYDDTGVEFKRRLRDENIKLRGFGSFFSLGDIRDAFEATLTHDTDEEILKGWLDGATVECRTSPDSQEGCPLPEIASERYKQVISETVERVIAHEQRREPSPDYISPS